MLIVASCEHQRMDAAEPWLDGEPSDADIADASAMDGGVDAGRPDAGVDLTSVFLDFCVRHIALLSEGRERCCPHPGSPLDPDAARLVCEGLANDAAVTDGTLEWDDAAARARLTDLESGLVSCAQRERRWDYSEVLTGTLGPGEVCTPQRPKNASVGRYRCREGLRCELSGTLDDFTGRCAPPARLGESCLLYDCEEGLYCRDLRDPDSPNWGRCEPIIDSGDCGSDLQCASVYCDGTCRDPTPAESWCAVYA